MSLFHSSGFYCRAPDSGVESAPFAKIKAAGFDGLALNVGDFEWSSWSEVVKRASTAGIACIPWARTLITPAVVSLCNLAATLPQKAVIVNAEDELIDGRVPAQFIHDQLAANHLDGAVSTLPWIGTPAVDLTPLDEYEVQLQLFPHEAPRVSAAARDCRAHAFVDGGAKRVSFMLGVHDSKPTELPPPQSPVWVYTLDDCLGDWHLYAPRDDVSLTETIVPYTGPLYGPSHPKFGTTPKKSKTAKALKLTLHEAGFANFGNPDLAYNRELERAMRRLQRWAGLSPLQGAYGRGSWEAIRRLASANPGGTFACTTAASALIQADAA